MKDLLQELDESLERVVEEIPWAERAGNRVVFAEGWIDRTDGEAGLMDLCSEIRMADVDAGWFVHPAERRRIGDPFVPVELAGLGSCTPLGTDGSGRWLVVDGNGRVLHLAEGSIESGRFRTSTDPPFVIVADGLHDLVQLLIERASGMYC